MLFCCRVFACHLIWCLDKQHAGFANFCHDHLISACQPLRKYSNLTNKYTATVVYFCLHKCFFYFCLHHTYIRDVTHWYLLVWAARVFIFSFSRYVNTQEKVLPVCLITLIIMTLFTIRRNKRNQGAFDLSFELLSLGAT